MLGLNSALRISDMLLLQWENVYDYKQNCFRKHLYIKEKKTGKKTVIALNPQAQQALADFMDTSEVEVCNWKTNKRFPGWDKIIIFAYVFQIPLDKLVARKITKKNDTVNDIREKIKSIDEKNLIKTIEKYRNSTSISPLEYRNVRWNPLLQDWVSIEEYEETISKILSET